MVHSPQVPHRRLADPIDHRDQLSPAVQSRLADIETELDAIHPGWISTDVKRRRFDHFDYDRMARTKWLLKWRSLLLHVREGRPDPLVDWKVIIAPGGPNSAKCFAHAIPPDARTRYTTDAPALVSLTLDQGPAKVRPPVSAPKLAAELGVPLERVEQALAAMPEDRDPSAWVRGFVRKEDRRARA